MFQHVVPGGTSAENGCRREMEQRRFLSVRVYKGSTTKRIGTEALLQFTGDRVKNGFTRVQPDRLLAKTWTMDHQFLTRFVGIGFYLRRNSVHSAVLPHLKTKAG